MVKFILAGLLAMYGLGAFASADSVSIRKLDSVAALLKIPEMKPESKKIELPAVPVGYRLELKGSDKLPVVDREGNVGQPLTAQEVSLYLVLTDVATGQSTDKLVRVNVVGEKTPEKGTNPCPAVIPALREWVGGTGKFRFEPKGQIVIDPVYEKELRTGAERLAADLKELSGWDYAVVAGTSRPGVIYMTLATADRQLGEEGYRMNISDRIAIESPAAKGAFWGTRTVLQMLVGQGTELAKGETRDYPKYSRRGFMLDVARKYIRLDFVQAYVKIMSFYKMNDFHVHLNDNAFPQFFDNDWDKTYAAFRLECETFPGLTAKDGFYTKKEFTALQKMGMAYGVNVTPEIDVPAHSLAFSHYRKSLGSQKYGMDHLDLFNPEVYGFLDSLFQEYLAGPEPVFVGPEVHVGTDEYSKEAAEEFRAFTDHYLRLVQGYGKRARLWGALSHAPGKTPVTSENVIMNAWYNGYADPKEMIRQGYDLISTPDGFLYIVPAAGYYYDYLNTKYLYNSWEPVMIGNQVFPAGHPQVLGGAFAVWNDHSGNGITEKDIHHRAFPAMQVLAEKMWTGTRPGADYEAFRTVAARMIEAPGVNLMGKVKTQSHLVLDYKTRDGQIIDAAANDYNPVAVKGVKIGKDGMTFGGRSVVESPVPEIGYDYTVRFDLCPAKDNRKDAILFRSPHAEVILNEAGSGKLAFKREGYCYNFNFAPESGKWVTIAIQGDNRGTALYVDGRLVEDLRPLKRTVKNKNGKESSMHIQRTLVFPLQQIGDPENGFRGVINNIEVFNQKLY